MLNRLIGWKLAARGEKAQDGNEKIEEGALKCAQEKPGDETKKLDPGQIARLQAMNERLKHVLRMAAMGMLREENGGMVMEAESERVCMPDAKTLFEAYLTLDAIYGEDWHALDAALEAPWAKQAVEMVLSPEAHVGAWRALRMRLVVEALTTFKRYGGEGPETRDPKCFALIGLDICDKVIALLDRGGEGEITSRV